MAEKELPKKSQAQLDMEQAYKDKMKPYIHPRDQEFILTYILGEAIERVAAKDIAAGRTEPNPALTRESVRGDKVNPYKDNLFERLPWDVQFEAIYEPGLKDGKNIKKVPGTPPSKSFFGDPSSAELDERFPKEDPKNGFYRDSYLRGLANNRYDALASKVRMDADGKPISKPAPKPQKVATQEQIDGWEQAYQQKDTTQPLDMDRLFADVREKIDWDKLYKVEVPKVDEWERNYHITGRHAPDLLPPKGDGKPIDWNEAAANVEKKTGIKIPAEKLQEAAEKDAMLYLRGNIVRGPNTKGIKISNDNTDASIQNPEAQMASEMRAIAGNPERLVSLVTKFASPNWEEVSERVKAKTGFNIPPEQMKEFVLSRTAETAQDNQRFRKIELDSGWVMDTGLRKLDLPNTSELTVPGNETDLQQKYQAYIEAQQRAKEKGPTEAQVRGYAKTMEQMPTDPQVLAKMPTDMPERGGVTPDAPVADKPTVTKNTGRN